MNYFITGTDTGVGKTLVATAILSASRQYGAFRSPSAAQRMLRPLKPVACGGDVGLQSGTPVQDDALLLCAACDMDFRIRDINPIFFSTPAAPTVAARQENVSVNIDIINQAFDRINESGDIAIVEGAGGLLVPLTDELTFADWAAARGLSLIIVSRAGLGAINHTALTLEAAKRRGIFVTAVVLNATAPDQTLAFAKSNRSEISRSAGFPLERIFLMPYADGNAPMGSDIELSVNETLRRINGSGVELAPQYEADVRTGLIRTLQAAPVARDWPLIFD